MPSRTLFVVVVIHPHMRILAQGEHHVIFC